MKITKRVLMVLATLCILFSATVQAVSYQYFPDVPDEAQYAYEINFLKEAGIFSGDGTGNFNPNKTMTRAEAATIMVRLFIGDIESVSGSGSFTDVASTHWAYGYIETAVKHGMISGYGGGKFGPADELTYNQAVTLLVKAMGYEETAGELGGWPDGYIAVGDTLGITNDTAKLSNNPVTRSTVAKLIYNSWYADSYFNYDDESDGWDSWEDWDSGDTVDDEDYGVWRDDDVNDTWSDWEDWDSDDQSNETETPSVPFVPVTSITGVRTNIAGQSGQITFSLSSSVANPGNATNRSITWSVERGNASISGNTVTLDDWMRINEVVLKATVRNGLGIGVDYVYYFAIAGYDDYTGGSNYGIYGVLPN